MFVTRFIQRRLANTFEGPIRDPFMNASNIAIMESR